MKNRYKSTFAWLGAMLLLVACTPDNPELGNIIPQSELNFSITQNPEKDNIIYLENKTAGIILIGIGVLVIRTNRKIPYKSVLRVNMRLSFMRLTTEAVNLLQKK